MECFSTLVGTHFRSSEAKQLVNALAPGDEVQLEAEPDNPYDGNAVMCLVRGEHVGYLSRENNAEVSERLLVADSEDEAPRATVVGRDGRHPLLLIEWDD